MNEAILSDRALEDPKEDRLGFSPFAKNLADAICNVSVEECLVFALYGPWGTGKTTLLNFVLHYINEKAKNEKPFVVRFNPWWFSGSGDLLRQFFKEFRVTLGKEKKFKGITKPLAEFVEAISVIPEPNIKLMGKVTSWFLRSLSKNKEAWQIRDAIRKDLKQQNSRILVVIDDIDRLSAEEIRSVFQVIKAVADFPKTLYLLAFDKGIVVKALESLQEMNGEDYIQKIVQVPFDLPMPDKIVLRKLFLEQLDIILSDTPQGLFDQAYWGNVFWDGIDHFLNTMRNIKRLTNALKVAYTGVKGEVNPVDFVAIETIRVFCSTIYQLMQSNPDMFTGYSDTHSYPRTEDIKPFHDKWIEQIREGDKEAIVNLLKRLFPKLDAVFGGSHYGSSWESTWRKQLRICSPDIFPIYFRLMVPEGQISHGEMQAILALEKNEETFGNKLIDLSKQHRPDGSTHVSAFLERMEDYTEKDIPKGDIPTILQALFNIGDKLLVPEDEGRGLFGWGNDIRIGRIMFQLLKRYENQDDRYKILKEVFSNGHAVSMIVGEVATLGQQHGKYRAQADPEDERLIGPLHLEELEKLALKQIREAALKDELIKTPRLGHILYSWRDWEDEESVRKWAAQVIANDEGLVDFLTGFLSKGYSQSIDDRVAKVRWRLDPKSLEPFIDPLSIIERCRNLLASQPGWLKDENKIAIETFIRWFDIIAQGKDPERELRV